MWPDGAQRADEHRGEQEGWKAVRGHKVHWRHCQAAKGRHPQL